MNQPTEHYVARVSAYKITVKPNLDRGSAQGDKRVKSEDVNMTVKSDSLDGLKRKVEAVLAIIDEDEFKEA